MVRPRVRTIRIAAILVITIGCAWMVAASRWSIVPPTDMKEFGQDAVTAVSQEFHNYRAIFIAKRRGIDVIGFNAHELDAYNSFKKKCREVFARANVLLDLFVIRRAPKFLGDKVNTPANQLPASTI